MQKQFRVTTYKGGSRHEYTTLEVELWPEKWSVGKSCKLEWQHTNGEPGLYGGRVVIEAEDSGLVVEYARRITRTFGQFRFYDKPRTALETLERKGYVQVGYHGFLGEYFPVSRWPEGKMFRAVDNQGKLLENIVARDENAARVTAMEKILALGERYLTQWIEGGCRVEEYVPVTSWDPKGNKPRAWRAILDELDPPKAMPEAIPEMAEVHWVD